MRKKRESLEYLLAKQLSDLTETIRREFGGIESQRVRKDYAGMQNREAMDLAKHRLAELRPPLTAHCSPDIAAWLDPAGGLQKAGLMKADIDAQDAPQSTLSFRHKLILARDDRALAAIQAPAVFRPRETLALGNLEQGVMQL